MSSRVPEPLLVVSESAESAMVAAAAKAHPNETGGILIGVYLDDQPWVTRAIEIPSPYRGRHHYKIPAGATQPAVHAARRDDHRLGYLGDWHTHPADVGPSPTDLATLALFSITHPLTPNPTLVVVRNTGDGYVIDARRILTITPRTCGLRIAGDLPVDPLSPEGKQ
ncbi:Mov34/MPN/PAD-1 family protein [Nocardioides sp.]|uniref:Mov34/MPN/PAD-1 family protein n=1 Tax=Nocardioides sp. TaxID=35761 RepID=UPI0025DB53FE|nr:Mov34/MPN/PAD-1 family protein [Nocardioides sp.]